MAFLASIPWLLTAMGLRKSLFPALYYIGNKQLVLLKNAQLMAFLAYDISVPSLLPFRERFFHKMAGSAIPRIILREAVITIADYYSQNSNYYNSGKDGAF